MRHYSTMLQIIGLDGEAEQVYNVLLDARPATGREVAAATGLTPAVVQAALRLLHSHGLVDEASGRPHAYVAVDPAIALDVLLLKHEEQLRRARARAQEVGERFHQAVAGRDPAETVEVITGREATVQRLRQIQYSARHELRCFDKPPYHLGLDSLNQAELDLLHRGGRARGVYEAAAVAVPGRRAQLAAYLAAGEQARVLPRLPTKLIVVDDRLAAVPLDGDDVDTAPAVFVIVHRSALLDALCELFEALWRLARPLDIDGRTGLARHAGLDEGAGAGEPARLGPDSLEREILELMDAGMPDAAIARRLGLSHRTLQRRIRGLMERFNAQTRYQLGVQAQLSRLAAPGPRREDDDFVRR
jgi:DNA-binding CsgD family transcriptional regulator/predicted transcriptional regulator